MWTRTYLFLLLVRLYFALAPSYIHPDENFQGPEVVAGTIFSYPFHSTWEFDPAKPTRSYFALFPVYALPLHVLHYLWAGVASTPVPPRTAFYVLRAVMFLLSFILEDWGVHELVTSPKQRRTALILVASSYVTWTYQSHTFSNSVETVVVLWCLVLIGRIHENKLRSHGIASFALGFLLVYGTFNRITFPAWLFFPTLSLLPHFGRKPMTLITIALAAALTMLTAIATDTAFYNPRPTFATALQTLMHNPVIAPLNSFLYNADTDNLANHGLHPRFTHLAGNLPQLLGPAMVLIAAYLARSPQSLISSPMLLSAMSGTLLLSVFPHQEARFLLPAVPLLLSCIHPPVAHIPRRLFLGTWIAFNLVVGLLFGIYHQGGVLPMQTTLGEYFRAHAGTGAGIEIFWWKSYSPPIWLLDSAPDGPTTRDLMGRPGAEVRNLVEQETARCGGEVWLVAPSSRMDVESWQGWVGEWNDEAEQDPCGRRTSSKSRTALSTGGNGSKDALKDLRWWRMHSERNHIGLDDLDIPVDGLLGTWNRVVGKRGLTAWKVKNCRC